MMTPSELDAAMADGSMEEDCGSWLKGRWYISQAVKEGRLEIVNKTPEGLFEPFPRA